MNIFMQLIKTVYNLYDSITPESIEKMHKDFTYDFTLFLQDFHFLKIVNILIKSINTSFYQDAGNVA